MYRTSANNPVTIISADIYIVPSRSINITIQQAVSNMSTYYSNGIRGRIGFLVSFFVGYLHLFRVFGQYETESVQQTLKFGGTYVHLTKVCCMYNIWINVWNPLWIRVDMCTSTL